MQNSISPTGPILLHLYQKVQVLFPGKGQASKEMGKAIHACSNAHELLDLLFSKDFSRDEVSLSLFEQRIHEIDAAYLQQSFFTI
jgi:hypothetical protein